MNTILPNEGLKIHLHDAPILSQVSTISIEHFRTNNNILMYSTAINCQFCKNIFHTDYIRTMWPFSNLHICCHIWLEHWQGIEITTAWAAYRIQLITNVEFLWICTLVTPIRFWEPKNQVYFGGGFRNCHRGRIPPRSADYIRRGNFWEIYGNVFWGIN